MRLKMKKSKIEIDERIGHARARQAVGEKHLRDLPLFKGQGQAVRSNMTSMSLYTLQLLI